MCRFRRLRMTLWNSSTWKTIIYNLVKKRNYGKHSGRRLSFESLYNLLQALTRDRSKDLDERHINMIAFSAVVGIGLFLQAGKVTYLAGPGWTVRGISEMRSTLADNTSRYYRICSWVVSCGQLWPAWER